LAVGCKNESLWLIGFEILVADDLQEKNKQAKNFSDNYGKIKMGEKFIRSKIT
jgi:hypothetical protein